MGKAAVAIELTGEEERELRDLAGRRRTAQGLARRARIVLLAAEGLENKEICAALDVDPNTVGKWRRRYAERRIDGLLDEPRPGRPREIGDDEITETRNDTASGNPLVVALHGAGSGPCALDDLPHLAGIWPAAAPC
jgi:DNA-binding CsgD family transcriptional regulator